MVFQEVVASFHDKVSTLSTLESSPNLKRDFEKTWEFITKEIDYVPVFDISLRILRNLPASAVLQSQLKSLLALSSDIASSKVLLRHDLFGRIYHTLLLGKLVKYYATFYTSIPAARLLARLLVNLPSGLDTHQTPPTYNEEPLKCVDLACGSGTLLSALYKEIDARHRIEAGNMDVDKLHRYLVEEGLWGFDVLHHAVHLAATALSLHNPIRVENSRLFALRLGGGDYLGSVNFLESNKLTPNMLLSGEGSIGGADTMGVAKQLTEEITLPQFHICIMNPPFTRSVGGNLLFGSLPKKERQELQKKLAAILKHLGLSGIGQAGLAAVFVFIADKYLREGGRVGFVLPRAVLSGVSWQKIRARLLERYDIEYIITSYQAPNDWNFSENTDLSEVLLVARKLKASEKKAVHTFFVNLSKKPTNEIEAIYIGSQLTGLYQSGKLYDVGNSNASPYDLKLHGKKIGEAYTANLTEDNFGIYNPFSQMELNRTASLLRNGIIYLPDQGVVGNIHLTTLADLGADIGPDRRQIHSTFSKTDSKTIYPAMWGYDSDRMTTIAQDPNSYLQPKENENDNARTLWSRSGKLLVVERAWLTTYPVLAVYSQEKMLSNVWWPVKIDEAEGKALAVWLNSTFGLLLSLPIAEVTRGPWIGFKKEGLTQLLVPNMRKGKRVEKLNDLYEEVSTKRLKSLPDEFAAPSVRKVIDDGVKEAFGIKADLSTLYKLLSIEPMITALPT